MSTAAPSTMTIVPIATMIRRVLANDGRCACIDVTALSSNARMSGERSSSALFVSYAAKLLVYTCESTSLSVSTAEMSAAGGDQ